MLAPEFATGEEDRRLTQETYLALRKRARQALQRERPNHTLQPTEIVHEIWAQLSRLDADLDHGHFLALAGCMMRNLLVDYARRRAAVRNGGGFVRAELNDEFLFVFEDHLRVLEVDEALNRLNQIDESAAKVVELRFFAGLTEEEVALALGIPQRKVKSDWAFAKAWMRSVFESNRNEA